MESYGQVVEWSPAGTDIFTGGTGMEESMQRLSIWGGEEYMQRPGEASCLYYMRTGVCKYGDTCQYHHPLDRGGGGGGGSGGGSGGAGGGGGGGDYPERVGMPECQHYKRTGSCKFGVSCKFHHPKTLSESSTTLNIYGYPLRVGEKECSYYINTGWCKFGLTCKFNHSHPSMLPPPPPPPPFYPTMQTLSDQYVGPGGYSPMLLHPGVVPIPNWSPYSVSSSSEMKENVFPERPGELECKFYMKTGDCKYGLSCKYHHPLEVLVYKRNCVLSPSGLPLRPGFPPCAFYLQNGRCKFGRACKYDHPVNYNPSEFRVDPYETRFWSSGIS